MNDIEIDGKKYNADSEVGRAYQEGFRQGMKSMNEEEATQFGYYNGMREVHDFVGSRLNKLIKEMEENG